MSNFWLDDKVSIYNCVICDVVLMDMENEKVYGTIEQMLNTHKGEIKKW